MLLECRLCKQLTEKKESNKYDHVYYCDKCLPKAKKNGLIPDLIPEDYDTDSDNETDDDGGMPLELGRPPRIEDDGFSR